MPRILPLILVCAGLLTAPLAATAAAPAPQPAASGDATPPAAPQDAPGNPAPAKAGPATVKSDAAEARYRAWVDREHAKDAAEFAKGKSKIEDKYKGYVRPVREKKDAKAAPVPAKGN